MACLQLCKWYLLAELVLKSCMWSELLGHDVAAATMMETMALVQTAEAFLEPHNAARAQVKVPPLQWNETLAAYARAHGQSQRDANRCEMMQHSGSSGYGENVFWGSHGVDTTAEWAVQYWISEREFYNYGANRCEPEFVECGQFTQVVWHDSWQVGCAAVLCHDASVVVVCEYSPPGNVAGMRPF